MLYLSTTTIEKAYQTLSSIDLQDPGVVFSTFILRACGINKVTFESPNFRAKNGFYFASRLSSLFSPLETQPKKYGFINPFSMKQWDSQSPSESLAQWVGSRLKNNVLGGAMTWRSLVDIDPKTEDKKMKFKYNYIDQIKSIAIGSDRINLVAIAVWSNRFTEFSQKVTAKEICDEFIRTYHLDADEIAQFFITPQTFEIDFSSDMHDASKIRDLIGRPKDNAWQFSEFTADYYDDYILEKYEFNIRPTDSQEVTIDLLIGLLGRYNQIILEGPPGTSKSYFASEIAKRYDKVFHVQFHPQYTYQNFVGGFVVDKTDVVYRKGVLLNIVEVALQNTDRSILLVIDEFNRANVSQVLGEAIQCLDRNQDVEITVDGKTEILRIPTNVHILATLNTSDRTLGSIDFAVKRRFMQVYCGPNPTLLIDLCPSVGFVSLCDFLSKLNNNLVRATNNKELRIGHAVFLNDSVKICGKYLWTFESFRDLYNYKILPMIQDYCSHNREIVEDVVGYSLSTQLEQATFNDAIHGFLEI